MVDLISQAEAASMMRVSARTLQRCAQRQSFPEAYRPNLKTVMYSRNDILAWMSLDPAEK